MLEQASAPLAPLTTLRVGGPARRMVTATTEQEIVDTVKDCDGRGEPLLILAGGSNLLIGDEGFDGTVLKIASTGVLRQKTCSGLRLGVAAGHDWDAFVAEAVALGAVGVEALSGIPGSAGATPIQNVGAYGQEVGQTIAWIRAFDRRDRRDPRHAVPMSGLRLPRLGVQAAPGQVRDPDRVVRLRPACSP